MKILMVCLGNICRSPLAEGILREKVKAANLNWEVSSAGTNRYHIGSAPHPLSQKVASINGLDISQQKARRLTIDDIETYDILFAFASDVMEDMREILGKSFNEEKVKYFMHELQDEKNPNVPDPWYGEEEGYHEVYKIIDKVCDAIINNYKNKI